MKYLICWLPANLLMYVAVSVVEVFVAARKAVRFARAHCSCTFLQELGQDTSLQTF